MVRRRLAGGMWNLSTRGSCTRLDGQSWAQGRENSGGGNGPGGGELKERRRTRASSRACGRVSATVADWGRKDIFVDRARKTTMRALIIRVRGSWLGGSGEVLEVLIGALLVVGRKGPPRVFGRMGGIGPPRNGQGNGQGRSTDGCVAVGYARLRQGAERDWSNSKWSNPGRGACRRG